MKRVGPHVSAAGGVHNAPLNAKKTGAKGFALFTKNQRQWKSKPLGKEEIDLFFRKMEECGYKPEHVLPHDSYLINIGNPEAQKRKRSLDSLVHEIERCSLLGLKYLNIHPGSHLRQISEERCLSLIAQNINRALDKTSGVTIVVENTAGQGSNVGYSFEHLAEIIDQVEDKDRIGVCYDTCHGFAAGYDIRDKKSFEKTFSEFENTIGFKYLKGVHLNDSMKELGSRRDRHESLGKGMIDIKGFGCLMNDPRFDERPFILETRDPDLWPQEIEMLYKL